MAVEKEPEYLKGLLETIKEERESIETELDSFEGEATEEVEKLRKSFEEQNEKLDSLIKSELQLRMGNEYQEDVCNIDKLIGLCEKSAGGGVRRQLSKLVRLYQKLKSQKKMMAGCLLRQTI